MSLEKLGLELEKLEFRELVVLNSDICSQTLVQNQAFSTLFKVLIECEKLKSLKKESPAINHLLKESTYFLLIEQDNF